MGGNDYQSSGGDGYKADLGKLITAYGLLSNKDEVECDFILMGPGCATEAESQAKANYIISLADGRKDCMACIGAHRTNLVAPASTPCLLYTSPSPRDQRGSRMPSSA